VSLLTGSAIYLLLASQQQTAAHEVNNLNRIMDMLLNNKNLSPKQKPHYEALRDALIMKQSPGHSGGLAISPSTKIGTWLAACQSTIKKL
jgi:hypothetical protein